MNKEHIIAEVKKKFWKRLTWFSVIAIAFLIGDEMIKEGYIFNVKDIVNPYSHELYILLFAIVGIVSAYISKVRGDGDELVE